MSLSTTLAEAKSSFDRMHDIVNRCYQEMTARLQALESRELDRMSHAQLTLHGRDSILSNVPIDTVRQSLVPELLSASGSNVLELEYLEELKRSWVYRRNSAFQLSTFSIDRHSTTWSCLSGLSLSEVSNISIINLAITVEDVNNPQRWSQTWSNDHISPLWPLLPDLTATGPLLTSGQHEEPRQVLRQPAFYDSETCSTSTATKRAEESGGTVLSNELFAQAVNKTAGRRYVYDPIWPESPLEQDDAAYPCKACGEVAQVGSISNALSGPCFVL